MGVEGHDGCRYPFGEEGCVSRYRVDEDPWVGACRFAVPADEDVIRERRCRQIRQELKSVSCVKINRGLCKNMRLFLCRFQANK